MNSKIFAGAIVFLFTCLAMPVLSLEKAKDIEVINRTIRYCVEVVHTFPSDHEMDRYFFKHFDAYYNPATGLVDNNAYRQGDLEPLYQFNKCMAAQGVPLGPVRK